eukprot:758359-Hanusia_phi.AAC.2
MEVMSTTRMTRTTMVVLMTMATMFVDDDNKPTLSCYGASTMIYHDGMVLAAMMITWKHGDDVDGGGSKNKEGASDRYGERSGLLSDGKSGEGCRRFAGLTANLHGAAGPVARRDSEIATFYGVGCPGPLLTSLLREC